MSEQSERAVEARGEVSLRVLRHMLREASDLLDETRDFAVFASLREPEQGENCAESLEIGRVTLILVDTVSWLLDEIAWNESGCAEPRMANTARNAAPRRVEMTTLSDAMIDLGARAERLYQRSLRLDSLFSGEETEAVRQVVNASRLATGPSSGGGKVITLDAFRAPPAGSAASAGPAPDLGLR